MSTKHEQSANEAVDNLFVCYTAQNYLKALYLSYRRSCGGERSRILALMNRGAAEASFFETRHIDWVEVVPMLHEHRYVRVLPMDRAAPLRFAKKVGEKIGLKLSRWHRARSERQHLLSQARRAKRVFLFLERSYFSNFLLRHMRCELIEEGSSTYAPFGRSWGGRLLAKDAAPQRFPGEHRNIERVWLRSPERAMPAVRAKATPFDLDYHALPERIRAVMLRLFPLAVPPANEPAALLVSQAWCWSAIEQTRVLEFYAEIVARLRGSGLSVWLKPHPAEDPATYAALGCRILNSRIPLDSLELHGRDALFDCAFSLLASSVETATHVARRVVTVFDPSVIVERVTAEQFERAANIALENLETVLRSAKQPLQSGDGVSGEVVRAAREA